MQGKLTLHIFKRSKSSMSSAFNLTLVQYFFPSGVVTLISMIVPSTNASCDTARKTSEILGGWHENDPYLILSSASW